MKITQLTIELFLAITEATIKMADRGLIAIQGVNEDDTSASSNGAGKSSIADALCWCLYGITARGVSGDNVVNNAAGKGTIVTAEVVDGNASYRIARHRKHKTGKNSLQVRKFNDATKMFDIDLTKGTDKLTQEVVNTIIGSSLEVFKGAIYAGQEDMPDLPGMTDKQLKLLIEEASGVTLLSDAYEEARQRLTKAKTDQAIIADALSKVTDRADWIKNEIEQTKDTSERWDRTRADEVKAIRAEIADRLKTIKELDKDIAASDSAGVQTEMATCAVKIASTKQETERYAQLTQEAATARGAVSVAQSTLTNAERILGRCESDLKNVEHKLGCDCTECGRAITEAELAAAKKAAQTKIDEAKEHVQNAQTVLKDAEKLATERAWAAQLFKDKMTDVSQVSAERDVLSAKLQNIVAAERHRDKFVMETKAMGGRVKALSAEVNPHIATLQDLNTRATKVGEMDKELVVKVKEANKAVNVADAVVKVFSPSGVRAFILDEVTPFLNQQTAKYLTTLSDGNIQATWTTLVKNAKGDLKEQFSIEVQKKNAANLFAGLSGGEKRKVRLASALALQDLVATRASKPIDLFIADEIDDALDDPGLERLMQILEDKASERGSIFIISHNSLRDWISDVVVVESKNGKTTVKEL